MIVRLTSAVLEERAAWLYLDRIVDTFPEGRHWWDLPADQDYRKSPWLSESPNHYRTRRNQEIYEKAFTAAAYPSAAAKHEMMISVTTVPLTSGDMTAADAARCLAEPVRVVVENDASDAAFVRAMIRTENHDELRIAIENEWVVFQHAGGCGEIPRRLRMLAATDIRPLRFIALSESDRLRPSDPISPAAQRIEDACTEIGCTAIILKKREVENYLPDEALHLLNSRKRHRTALRSFQKLSAEQRDHFDMKHGFSLDTKTNAVVLSPAEQDMFGTLRDTDLRALVGGFGSDVCDLFAQVPDSTGQTAMKNRCASTGSQEIAAMLERIRRLL